MFRRRRGTLEHEMTRLGIELYFEVHKFVFDEAINLGFNGNAEIKVLHESPWNEFSYGELIQGDFEIHWYLELDEDALHPEDYPTWIVDIYDHKLDTVFSKEFSYY